MNSGRGGRLRCTRPTRTGRSPVSVSSGRCRSGQWLFAESGAARSSEGAEHQGDRLAYVPAYLQHDVVRVRPRREGGAGADAARQTLDHDGDLYAPEDGEEAGGAEQGRGCAVRTSAFGGSGVIKGKPQDVVRFVPFSGRGGIVSC